MFYKYLDSLQENIHAKVSHGYSSVNMLRTCSRTSFLVKASGELLLYITLNIEIINTEVVSKKVKSCLKYFLTLLTLFLTFLRNFRLVAKEAVVVVDKTRARVYMCVFGN